MHVVRRLSLRGVVVVLFMFSDSISMIIFQKSISDMYMRIYRVRENNMVAIVLEGGPQRRRTAMLTCALISRYRGVVERARRGGS
jgi:hypothetical protein